MNSDLFYGYGIRTVKFTFHALQASPPSPVLVLSGAPHIVSVEILPVLWIRNDLFWIRIQL